MITRLPRVQPDVHEAAVGIAQMGCIIIQGFLPTDVIQQLEWRLYLLAVGEIQHLRQGRHYRCSPDQREGGSS